MRTLAEPDWTNTGDTSPRSTLADEGGLCAWGDGSAAVAEWLSIRAVPSEAGATSDAAHQLLC